MNINNIFEQYQNTKKVVLSPELQRLSDKLTNPEFDFQKLYGLYDTRKGNGPKNEIQQDYVDASELLSAQLCDDICNKLDNEEFKSQKEISDAVSKASHEYLIHMMKILNKSYDQLNSSWMSASISSSHVMDYINDHTEYHHKSLKNLNDFELISRQEEQLARFILENDYGKRNYKINNLVGDNLPVKDFYQEFSQKGTFEDLASLLLNRIQKFDGRYSEKDLYTVTNKMLTLALNRIYERCDITEHMLTQMIEDGKVSSMDTWDTNSFHEHFAPVITDEVIKDGQAYMDKFEPKDSLVFKLKDNLSKSEIFNHFISSELGSLNKWLAAMAQFGAMTGEKLTFKEAQALNPRHNFRITSTKAFSDLLDKEFNGDEYRTIEASAELVEDVNDEYHGEQAFEIYIHCKSLSISSINDEMSNEIMVHSALNGCGGGFDGMKYEGSTSSSNPQLFANDLALKIRDKLKALTEEHVLPGDVIQIQEHEDYELDDYEIKAGKKALVTDVDYNGGVKIKGDKFYYPNEITTIKKKHVLKTELSSDMSF